MAAGDDDPKGSEGDEGQEGTDATETAKGGDAGGDGKPAAGQVTMTQADLDRLIARKVGKAKAGAEKELKDWLDQQAMSETDRLKAEKDQASADAAAKVTTANRRLVAAEAKSAALAAGVKPDRVAVFLRNVDLDDDDLVDEDGATDDTAIAKLVADTLTTVPEFKGTTAPAKAGASGGEFNGHGDDHQFTQAEIAAMSVDEYAKHRDAIQKQLQAGTIK